MSCCTNDCCGPGSYCCRHAGPHAHAPASLVGAIESAIVDHDRNDGDMGPRGLAYAITDRLAPKRIRAQIVSPFDDTHWLRVDRPGDYLVVREEPE